MPVVPDIDGLRFQAVHGDDVGEAYRLALISEVSGAFNIAAEPVLDPSQLARILGRARCRSGPGTASRRSRVVQAAPAAVGGRLAGHGAAGAADGHRAGAVRARLGAAALRRRRAGDLLLGMREGAGLDTPPLEPGNAGPLRAREFLSGVGARTG